MPEDEKPWYDKVLDRLREPLRDAVLDFSARAYEIGIEDGLKKAAKATCGNCRQGDPVTMDKEGEWEGLYRHDRGDKYFYPCEAGNINALIEATGEVKRADEA